MTWRLIRRLKAAHALAFAMTGRQRPDLKTICDIGISGCDWPSVCARFDVVPSAISDDIPKATRPEEQP